MKLICARCQKPAERSGGSALYCLPCCGKGPRLAAPGRVRNVAMKPLRLGGSWACVDCRGPLRPSRSWPALRCDRCNKARYLARQKVIGSASSAVARAIRTGALPRPASFLCVDCGRPAAQYDHRDYTKPLDVQPVCRSCNVMRGHADVWPELITHERQAPAEKAAA